MPTIFNAPTSNFLQTTLNGSITSSAGTITLTSTAGLQAPGYIVIDRTDSNGVVTPNAREVVSYTGISGSDLTGCVRPADGSTARSHSDGAIVETTFTTGMYNNLATIVATSMTSDGYLKAINSPVSIAQIRSVGLTASLISVNDLRISNRLEISGASVTGIGMFPVWRTSGTISGVTAAIGGLIRAPKVTSFEWVSVLTRTVASAVSVVFDVTNNGTTIFAGITRPTIIGGGTYISTASINTPAVSKGNILRADVQAMGAGIGQITDVTIQAGLR